MEIALEFVRRQREADDVLSFFFRPTQPLTFAAGQFLELSLPHPEPDDDGTQRCLTIASAPSAEDLLQFTTRLGPTPSTFKQALCALQPAEVVAASGPYGDFVYADDGTPAVFIAGGIGITPFRSMLVELGSRAARPAATLLYSNASPDIAFQSAFDSLAAGWPDLRLVYTVTRPTLAWRGATGRIEASFIAAHVPDVADARFFVCGPMGFTAAIVNALRSLGVPAGRINQEAFPGYDAAAEHVLAEAA